MKILMVMLGCELENDLGPLVRRFRDKKDPKQGKREMEKKNIRVDLPLRSSSPSCICTSSIPSTASPSPFLFALGLEGIGVDNLKNKMLGNGGGGVFCPLTRLFGLDFVLSSIPRRLIDTTPGLGLAFGFDVGHFFTFELAFPLPPAPAVLSALLQYYSRYLRFPTTELV